MKRTFKQTMVDVVNMPNWMLVGFLSIGGLIYSWIAYLYLGYLEGYEQGVIGFSVSSLMIAIIVGVIQKKDMKTDILIESN